MATNFFKVSKGLHIHPATLPVSGSLGDVAYDSATSTLKQWNGSSWAAISGASNFSSELFSGTGAQTVYTLSADPGSINNTFVFISGVYQQKGTYTLSTTTLTFSAAPPSGTNNIEVNYGSALSVGTPSDGTVTNAKLANMPATTIKGNNTGGSAVALDLTVAQVNAILPVFTNTLNGLAPLSGGGTTNFLRADGSWSSPLTSGTVAIANGGTGQTSKAAAFDALSPMTTGGDLIVGSTSGTGIRLANGTAGQYLKSNGTTVAPSWATLFTNWTSYSPTFTNLTEGNGTKRFYYRRVGDSIHLKGVFIFGSTSSVSGTIKFTLPSGLTIDTSKTVGASSGQSFYEYIGISTYYHSGVGAHYTIFQDSNSTNTFYIDGGSGVWNATVPVTWTTASEIHITEFSIPIAEWAL